MEGYEHQEIAELLNCSVGNSKSQLHKAKLRIREVLLRAQKQAGTSGSARAIRQRTRKNSADWETGGLASALPALSFVSEFAANGA